MYIKRKCIFEIIFDSLSFLFAGNNPCRSGNPFQLGGNAVSCDRQSCPSGFRCNRGRNFAVCCPGISLRIDWPLDAKLK